MVIWCTLTLSQLIIYQGTYKLGIKGEDSCPIGYNSIKNPIECAAAANEFGYVWNEHAGKKNKNSVCNYCTGCTPIDVRVSSDHGSKAFWMCKKGDF